MGLGVGGYLDDTKKLWKDHRVSVRNCVDLALLARSVDTRWKGPYKGGIGLSRLAEIYLKRRLPKGGTQRSNWEMELSMVQQECEFWYFQTLLFSGTHHAPSAGKKSVEPTSTLRLPFSRRGE